MAPSTARYDASLHARGPGLVRRREDRSAGIQNADQCLSAARKVAAGSADVPGVLNPQQKPGAERRSHTKRCSRLLFSSLRAARPADTDSVSGVVQASLSMSICFAPDSRWMVRASSGCANPGVSSHASRRGTRTTTGSPLYRYGDHVLGRMTAVPVTIASPAHSNSLRSVPVPRSERLR